ncbi:lycopene cyclase family protein [Persicimonas caeni]|uniref:Lycopene cyclase family protein n=1 Tax=Persicimonas caeni TaxID=2292766 RepID=A0A4Y6PTX9_PERCE|nr:lycopene cyclase family protein [Persicimonas caeni]QDG51225.1 lycopene cyclase family protein [Persicimonas caeni]QED32446.1 lycopene cyclase family protein [Persicimonas caeni]
MDVLVVGAGPAGMAASAALARAGLDVGCLAPSHPSPWPNNYGLWEDEIAGLGLADCYDRRWDNPVAYTSKTHAHHLDRVYLRLDNQKLRARLTEWCDAHGVRWLEGFAASTRVNKRGITVLDRHGQEYTAALLIDATGHRPKFVEREQGGANASQAAYGFVGDFDGDPIGGDDLVLMDFREDFLDAGPRRSPEATFLYAMNLGDGRYFVEETSLVHRPAMTFDVLEERLAQRLRARGVPVVGVEDVERCLIPMNSPMPLLDQQVVGFGAAASMVHPATGYQMARMLRTAPELAGVIAEQLGKLGADPKDAAQSAWRTIWPEDQVRARKLWMFGLECLLRLEPAQTRRFFEVFFSLPGEYWKGYMSGTLAPAEIARVMWSLFRVAPMSLRMSLTKTAMGREGWEMIRALAG